jgi:hypothetical protein
VAVRAEGLKQPKVPIVGTKCKVKGCKGTMVNAGAVLRAGVGKVQRFQCNACASIYVPKGEELDLTEPVKKNKRSSKASN